MISEITEQFRRDLALDANRDAIFIETQANILKLIGELIDMIREQDKRITELETKAPTYGSRININ